MGVSSISSQSTASYWEEIFSASSARESQPKGDNLAAKLFQDLDADQSGGIGLKESGLSQSKFAALDTDQDGSVSLAELQAGLELQKQAFFTNIKMADGEDSTAAAETTQDESGQSRAQGILSAIMNGKPLPPPPGGHGGKGDFGVKLFADLDADSSGGLSLAESGQSQSVFDAMDTNQDGVVSPEELTAALQQQMKDSLVGRMGDQTSSQNNASSLLNTSGGVDLQRILSALADSAYRSMSYQGTAKSEGGVALTA